METDTLGILVKLSIADGELDIGTGIEARCCTARRRKIVGEVMRAKRGVGEEQKLMRICCRLACCGKVWLCSAAPVWWQRT